MDRKDFLKVVGWSAGGAALWLIGCHGGEDTAQALSTSSAAGTSAPGGAAATEVATASTAASASPTTASSATITTAAATATEVVRELPVINGYVNEVSIVEQGAYRVIRANGIPDHEVGAFPNPGNPNTIAPIEREYRVPLVPAQASSTTDFSLGAFGVAVNGIPFDPGAAEFWNRDQSSGWQYEALGGGVNLGTDENDAHVQPSGQYHYHGTPDGLYEVLGVDGTSMVLVGWAADGFPIYAGYGYASPSDATSAVKELRSGYRVKDGTRPSGPGGAYDGTFVQDYEWLSGLGDLDRNNGRFTVTPEFPEGTYAYFLTEQYPFIPRSWVGTPDSSFGLGAGGGTGGAGSALDTGGGPTNTTLPGTSSTLSVGAPPAGAPPVGNGPLAGGPPPPPR